MWILLVWSFHSSFCVLILGTRHDANQKMKHEESVMGRLNYRWRKWIQIMHHIGSPDSWSSRPLHLGTFVLFVSRFWPNNIRHMYQFEIRLSIHFELKLIYRRSVRKIIPTIKYFDRGYFCTYYSSLYNSLNGLSDVKVTTYAQYQIIFIFWEANLWYRIGYC